ncbi:hypothetical protein BVRB_5g118410 [Beta vulgaris subsp. vulgaris]|uniref:uncharacterized protein LOC104894421 isoform X2 n=1 Tax=Beta vulgaris subsp. vulgaris TaxID=3555 RepID=UPI00053F9D80|nr:uncharacterized protein LOC104894421 isoform X2 [Beta vulgaris subsp. vulgaris]KMT10078.1 hypothetical protein BVRB_5g118410 [Beta vulgaris subsp. vulgaris]
MDEYRWNYHVPAFGSWDYEDGNLPYTQCFESARQTGFGRFGGYSEADVEHRDLYVAGDLYQNDIVTPAVILVPRRSRRKGESGYSNVKGVKKQQQIMQKQDWGGYSYDIKEPPSPILSPPKSKSKPVDEDLYKIPPEYLHVKPKRKKRLGLFSSCLLPACA